MRVFMPKPVTDLLEVAPKAMVWVTPWHPMGCTKSFIQHAKISRHLQRLQQAA
jgi:hypothetical protein